MDEKLGELKFKAMNLNTIEIKYDFSYPKIYQDLLENGMLNWGVFGPNWVKNEFPKLKNTQPLLLFGDDFELLDFDSIDEEIIALKDPDDYRQTNPKFNFIPFGKNGAGDLYCFQFDAINNNEIPIVLVWHDEDKATVFAKNLQDFIFRSMLETIVNFETEYSLLSEGDFYENLSNYRQSHVSFLSDAQKKRINFWYSLIIDNKRLTTQLLSDSEVEKLKIELNTLIHFPDLNTSFEYQLEEQIPETTEFNKRRVGNVIINYRYEIKPDPKIETLLKELNWRENKLKIPNSISLFRNNMVVFGIPSLVTLGEPFLEKLTILKNLCQENIELTFTENETNQLYKI